MGGERMGVGTTGTAENPERPDWERRDVCAAGEDRDVQIK